MKYVAGDLLLPLNEPDQIGFPENLVSSLVARAREVPDWRDSGGGGVDQKKLLLYVGNENIQVKGLTTIRTEPRHESSSGRWQLWVDAIRNEFNLEQQEYEALAVALRDSIKGVQVLNSRNRRGAVVPLTVSVALLQNSRGALGKAGPANFGLILEQMFMLGKSEDENNFASIQLVEALERQTDSNVLLSAIDKIVQSALIEGGVIFPSSRAKNNSPESSKISPGTNSPFAWFQEMFCRLMTEEWIDVLPTRRWIDWVTAILRLSLGFGILWESRWYQELGTEILSPGGGPIDPNRVVRTVNSRPLMSWQPSRMDDRSRNVQQEIRGILVGGYHVKKFLIDLFEQGPERRQMDLSQFSDLVRTSELAESLQNRLKNNYSKTSVTTLHHRWDAIESCLTVRDASSDGDLDYYGMLSKRGRGTAVYRVLDPSTEILAVLASLSRQSPRMDAQLGDVRRQLVRLGLRPLAGDLAEKLETAGLCSRIADADDSVPVRCAFEVPES